MSFEKPLLDDDSQLERTSSLRMEGYFTPRNKPSQDGEDSPRRSQGAAVGPVFSDDETHHFSGGDLSGGDSAGDESDPEQGFKYHNYEVVHNEKKDNSRWWSMGGGFFCVVLCVGALIGPLLFYKSQQKPDVKPAYFFQITDLHYDPFYDPRRPHTCRCRNMTSVPQNQACPETAAAAGEAPYAPFGRPGCDSPYALIEEMFTAMKKVQSYPSFILLSGDLSAHDIDTQVNNTAEDPDAAASVTQRNIRDMGQLLRQYFPASAGINQQVQIPVMACLGNDDVNPDYFYPGQGQPGYQANFASHGYYFYRLGTLRVIVLNTIFYTKKSTYDPSVPDPEGQFAWLEQTLLEARQELHTAYIIGHIPPGYDSYCTADRGVTPTWDRNPRDLARYAELMLAYDDVVKGEFFGHTHTDLFRLVQGDPVPRPYRYPSPCPHASPRLNYHTVAQGPNTTAAANSGRLFVSGGASPIFYQNPRFRVYKYSPADYQLLDYTDYVKRLDLYPDGSSGFVEEYAALSEYRQWGLKSLSTAGMSRFALQLKANSTAFGRWYWNVYGRNEEQKDTHPIPAGCTKQMACAVQCVLPGCFSQCMGG